MKRILLAEDDNDMRQFLTRALKNAGYDVVSFDNGRSAYERLREEPFSLLLSDIVMPEMDGIELARRATELDPDLKVMFITGFAAVALNPDSEAPKDASVLSRDRQFRPTGLRPGHLARIASLPAEASPLRLVRPGGSPPPCRAFHFFGAVAS
eukprot:gene58388-77904_t